MQRSGRSPIFAASLSTEACNLWTQGLHANRIKALTARPETDNIGRPAPIGIVFGITGKNRSGACVMQMG